MFRVFIIALILVPIAAFAYEKTIAEKAALENCKIMFEKLDAKAFDFCTPLAENDDIEAQNIMGHLFYMGVGGPANKDYKKTVLWWKKAAMQGSDEAKYNLAILYEKGIGLDMDYNRAYKWYLSAAKDGNKNAQFNVANMYAKGAGVAVSLPAAFKWYKAAAEQGVKEAQYNLANRYAKGRGVSVDLVEAYKWYLILEEDGDVDAASSRIFMEKELSGFQKIDARKRSNLWREQYESKR